MDEFGMADYLRPGSATNDYRTSTYRGNRYLDYQTNVPQMRCSTLQLEYSDASCIEPSRKSEQQVQFGWKPLCDQPIRTPFHQNVKYMSTFNKTHFHHPPKQLKAVPSTYRNDFNLKSQPVEETVPTVHVPGPEDHASKPFLTNRVTPNSGKLLDPSATTCNLAYRPYTKDDLSISSKDNITFWNWNDRRKDVFNVRQTVCDPFKTKRYNEYKCPVNHVPNHGLTTVMKSDYIETLDFPDFDISHVGYDPITVPDLLPPMETENGIYGSGKRIQTYIDTGRLIF